MRDFGSCLAFQDSIFRYNSRPNLMNGIACSQLQTLYYYPMFVLLLQTGLSLSKQLLGSTYPNKLRGKLPSPPCVSRHKVCICKCFFLLDCAECVLSDAQVVTNLSLLSSLQWQVPVESWMWRWFMWTQRSTAVRTPVMKITSLQSGPSMRHHRGRPRHRMTLTEFQHTLPQEILTRKGARATLPSVVLVLHRL